MVEDLLIGVCLSIEMGEDVLVVLAGSLAGFPQALVVM